MLLRHSALYFLANAVTALVGFASVYVFTRLMSPDAYGIVVGAMAVGTVFATLLFSWLRHAVLRFQSEAGADVRLTALLGFAGTLLAYPLLVAVAVLVARIPLQVAIAAALFALGVSLFELGQEILRARQLPVRVLLMAAGRSALSFCLCLMVVKLGGGGFGFVLALAFSYMIAVSAQAPRILDAPLVPVDRTLLSTMFRFGAPISFSGLLFALYASMDKIVLASLSGAAAVGVYGATADLVRQCVIYPALGASFALAPIAFRSHGDGSGSERAIADNLRDGIELLLAMLLPTVVGLAIVAPLIAPILFGESFRETAALIIPVLAFAWFAQSISQQYIQLSFTLAKKPNLFNAHNGSALAAGALIMVPFVYQWGVWGAAWAMVIAEVVGVTYGIRLTRSAFPLPWPIARIAKIAAAALIMAAATLTMRSMVAESGVTALVTVVATGVVSYVAAALALNVMQSQARVGRLVARCQAAYMECRR